LLFVVLNLLLVIPHLSDVDRMYFRLEIAQKNIAKYQAELAQTNAYALGLRELDRKGGLDVPVEEQSSQFANAIQAQAGQSKVNILSNGKILTQTNQFFLEKSQSISVQAGEEQLVDFLYNLGSGVSLIRVRELGLRPDPPRQQLVATIKLVASYQKKSLARPVSPVLKPQASQITGTERLARTDEQFPELSFADPPTVDSKRP
jgi:hypothetical protein